MSLQLHAALPDEALGKAARVWIRSENIRKPWGSDLEATRCGDFKSWESAFVQSGFESLGGLGDPLTCVPLGGKDL